MTAELVYDGNTRSNDAGFGGLGQVRVYILVVESVDVPSDAYVTVVRRGKHYSILDDDGVSKRNLELLNQILTIQAVPTPAPAPTQTASGR